ncbi:predicted protein [Nematostella vectensis]|uniref:Uncharacterized protein n=1 Tax=Nematostella vectensis TaxID=45351 RepID=A7RMJ3_NEMVE|nr:predicted protein [Nematostella vectensis]|eukprot:XP_001639417.1 predicted protein [Nematostella vectensis]
MKIVGPLCTFCSIVILVRSSPVRRKPHLIDQGLSLASFYSSGKLSVGFFISEQAKGRMRRDVEASGSGSGSGSGTSGGSDVTTLVARSKLFRPQRKHRAKHGRFIRKGLERLKKIHKH